MSAEPPLLPGADEARRWASEELARPEYRDAAPSWLADAWETVLDWLNSIGGQPAEGAPVPSPVIGIVIAAIIAAAVIVARPRLNAKHRKANPVFESASQLTAGDFRERAAKSAAEQRWGDAVVDLFRAMVRSAEYRTILDPEPGRTADEAARGLSAAFGAETLRLDQAARTFDAVRYGNTPAEAADYRDLASLDAALETARPAPAGTERSAALP
ncbi:hypothetical protein ASF72_09065 [Arthrobacter sp. Leaf141]|uniref:DUF4129 domain-containing protein n=1 Tax=Micrococcaceae TaxID=1268 RepID=UPI0006FEB58F|nr:MULTISPECIES: DUF4129 domain-containing protein [Micrococcaceae]KQR03299.1 hypothetical protein ASF72_09065 [Arthrobacter sp. Leaf141]